MSRTSLQCIVVTVTPQLLCILHLTTLIKQSTSLESLLLKSLIVKNWQPFLIWTYFKNVHLWYNNLYVCREWELYPTVRYLQPGVFCLITCVVQQLCTWPSDENNWRGVTTLLQTCRKGYPILINTSIPMSWLWQKRTQNVSNMLVFQFFHSFLNNDWSNGQTNKCMDRQTDKTSYAVACLQPI